MKHFIKAHYDPHTERVVIRERLFTRLFYTGEYRTEMKKLVGRLAAHHESDCSVSSDGYVVVAEGDRHQYMDPVRGMFTERKKQPRGYWETIFDELGLFN
jgi:hypothetical protein